MARPVEVALPVGHADAIGPTPYPMAEAPAGLLQPVGSFAKGLPPAIWPTVPGLRRLDPAEVDPLRPETWRPWVDRPGPLPAPHTAEPLRHEYYRQLGLQALACLKSMGFVLLVLALALACTFVDVAR